jgi:hypothetical protein
MGVVWPSGLFRISCRQYASGADFSRSRSAGVFACFVAPIDVAHVAEMVKHGIEAASGVTASSALIKRLA